MVPAVLVTALWGEVGVWLARRRGGAGGWRAVAGAAFVAACTALALAGRGAPAAVAAGAAFGVGAVFWREAAGGRDALWLGPVGVLGGVGLYAAGWIWACGAGGGALTALGMTAAGGLAEMAEGLGAVRRRPVTRHVLVCWGPACQRQGARALRRSLAVAGRGMQGLRVTPVSCLGRCAAAPAVWVEPEGTLWTRVEPGDHPGVLGLAERHPGGGG